MGEWVCMRKRAHVWSRLFLIVSVWTHKSLYTHTHTRMRGLHSPTVRSSTKETLVTAETETRTTRGLCDSLVLQHIDNLPLLIDCRVDSFARLPLPASLFSFHSTCFAGCLLSVALLLSAGCFPCCLGVYISTNIMNQHGMSNHIDCLAHR